MQILALLQVLLLGSTSLLQEYLAGFHRQQLQRGYLRFCDSMQGLVSISVVGTSYCTALALILVLWPGKDHIVSLLFSALLTVELVAVASQMLYYTWRLVTPIMRHPRPDVYEELTSPLATEPMLEVHGRRRDELVERQATLLRFQHARWEQLSLEVHPNAELQVLQPVRTYVSPGTTCILDTMTCLVLELQDWLALCAACVRS